MNVESRVAIVMACLGFTGLHVARADPSQQLGIEYIENPYAPHTTEGSTLRLGTSVGYLHGENVDALAIGGTLAVGQRWGRLQLEAELGLAQLDSTDSTDTKIGAQQRLGINARFDVIRLGSRYMGPNSMLAIYVEGGAARVWTQFETTSDDVERTMPNNSARVEGQAGFGLMIEHRLQEPITIPRRVGWFLGWREGFTPHDAEGASVCRGTSCRSMTTTSDSGGYTDRALLFQSSMQVTW